MILYISGSWCRKSRQPQSSGLICANPRQAFAFSVSPWQVLFSDHARSPDHPIFFLNVFPNLSNSAAHMIGKPTVASTKTSPKRPPSAGGTNLPQEMASEYGEPESPPQYTGSGQTRTP